MMAGIAWRGPFWCVWGWDCEVVLVLHFVDVRGSVAVCDVDV